MFFFRARQEGIDRRRRRNSPPGSIQPGPSGDPGDDGHVQRLGGRQVPRRPGIEA